MSYNPDHVSLAYYNNGELIALDFKGNVVFTKKIPVAQAEDELEGLECSDDNFIFSKKPLCAFNPTFVNEIVYEPLKIDPATGKSQLCQHKNLVFYDHHGVPFYSLNTTYDHAEYFFESAVGGLIDDDDIATLAEAQNKAKEGEEIDPDFVRTGTYLRIPGKMHMASYDTIAAVYFDEESKMMAYSMPGGRKVFSERLSLEKGRKLEEHYNEQDEFETASASATPPDDEDAAPAKPATEAKVSTQQDDGFDFEAVEADFNQRIFGQPQPIKETLEATEIALAGLKEENKPVGSFLFLGPSGVGKTELARQLAKILKKEFVKIDMGEYGQSHDGAKLLGSPPGYIGYEQKGKLQKEIKKGKEYVVVFDEIEKADDKIFDLLLAATDDARITDAQGNIIDLRDSIIIFTSNIRLNTERKLGFGAAFEAAIKNDPRLDPKLRERFRPEMLNRIDFITEFNELKLEDIARILDKLTAETNKQLEEKGKNISIEIAPLAKQHLAKEGYSADFGARPLKRLFNQQIKTAVAREMVRKGGKLRNGGRVHVNHEAGAGEKGLLTIAFTPAVSNDNDLSTQVAAPDNPSLPSAAPG